MRRTILLTLIMFLVFSTGPDDLQARQKVDHLRMFWMTNPTEISAAQHGVNSLVEGFRTEYGISVEVTLIDWTEGLEKIHEAFASGTPPDLSIVGARWVPELVASGYIEPLDRYMTRSFRRRFIPSVIERGAVYQGRVFGLPVNISTRALYYNRSILQRAEIEEPPQTWAELLEVGQRINALGDDNIYGFGLQAGNGIETNTYFYYFLWGNGGDLYNASLTASHLNKPEAVEALEFTLRLVEEGATQPDVTRYDRRNRLEFDFLTGRAGMIITGAWLAPIARETFANIDFGVAPIPYNTTPFAYAAIDPLVMFQTSRDKDLAWALMEYIFRDEFRYEYVTTSGGLPALQNVAEQLEMDTQNPELEIFIGMLEHAQFEPLHTETEVIADIVIDAVVNAHRGIYPAQEALDNAVVEIDALLSTASAGW